MLLIPSGTAPGGQLIENLNSDLRVDGTELSTRFHAWRPLRLADAINGTVPEGKRIDRVTTAMDMPDGSIVIVITDGPADENGPGNSTNQESMPYFRWTCANNLPLQADFATNVSFDFLIQRIIEPNEDDSWNPALSPRLVFGALRSDLALNSAPGRGVFHGIARDSSTINGEPNGYRFAVHTFAATPSVQNWAPQAKDFFYCRISLNEVPQLRIGSANAVVFSQAIADNSNGRFFSTNTAVGTIGDSWVMSLLPMVGVAGEGNEAIRYRFKLWWRPVMTGPVFPKDI